MTSVRQVGVIYGKVGAIAFDMAVSDRKLKRLDYVMVETRQGSVLGQVLNLTREGNVSFDDAMNQSIDSDDKLSASVQVIGFMDTDGRVQVPRTPFKPGSAVHMAPEELVIRILGLHNSHDKGAYLGHVKGSKIPVQISMNTLAQKHLSVLAKTGAGKSYTVAVVLEEFLESGVPLVILDPHGEYGSLRNANTNEQEVQAMLRYRIKPKSYNKIVREFAIDTNINPDAKRIALEGMNLEGREIVDMLGSKLSGGQVGVLYQAIKEVKEHLPAYTLHDIMDAVNRNKSASKWNVLNALEALDSTGVFAVRGTPIDDIVQPGICSIINLKGVAPDIQDVVVTRITNMLWEARKRNEIPPHILVVEEAHNFCPERGVGNAISGAVLRTVASEGRKFGMGLVIVSQRPAKIDKNVISQCNTQIVLKVTNPNDLKAITSSVEGITSEAADEVQRLPVGVALVAGGGLTQPVYVDVRPRRTRHGGASIDIVESKQAPAQWELPEEAAHVFEEEEEPVDPLGSPEPAPAFAAPEHAWPEPDDATPATPIPEAPVPEAPEPAESVPDSVPAALPDPEEIPTFNTVPPVPKPRKITYSPKELMHVHRVANRVGLVGQGSKRTRDVLTRLAQRNQRDPEDVWRLYLEIGEAACLESDPFCVRCPLRLQCRFHADLQETRNKKRNPIRRLWG